MSRVALGERARYSIDLQHCIFKNDAAGRFLALQARRIPSTPASGRPQTLVELPERVRLSGVQ